LYCGDDNVDDVSKSNDSEGGSKEDEENREVAKSNMAPVS
jgi:hypothetical protein